MAAIAFSAPLIVRLPTMDVNIGTVEFPVEGTPQLTMNEHGVQLAATTVSNMADVPAEWAFNPAKRM